MKLKECFVGKSVAYEQGPMRQQGKERNREDRERERQRIKKRYSKNELKFAEREKE